MKKFRFRLEPLLTLRKQKEDEEFRKLSLIVGKINRIREEIDAFASEISAAGEEISKKIHTGAGMRDYTEYSDISRNLSLKIQSLEKEIEEVNPELDLARIRLNEASKEKKILEILKENEWKLHKRKIQKTEKKELEETILIKTILEPSAFLGINTDKEIMSTVFHKMISEDMEEDYEEGRMDATEEVHQEEKPMTELEKLQKYYEDFTKR